MKTLLMYLENNGMLVDPKDVPDGLDPTFYIGLDRNFEIDIRTKINKEIKDIKDLERQLEEARELLVKSNSQLDLTWYAIGCTVDDHAIKRLKSIYHRELDKLKDKGDEN